MELEEDRAEETSTKAGCRSLLLPIGMLAAIMVVIVLPFSPLFHEARQIDYAVLPCLLHVKWTALAVAMYAGDNDDRLPPSTWMDATARYTGKEFPKEKDIYRCLQCPVKGGYGYAMNQRLPAQPLASIGEPGTTALTFDSDLTNRNAVGSLATLPFPPRHKTRPSYKNVNFISYANGHARGVGMQ